MLYKEHDKVKIIGTEDYGFIVAIDDDGGKADPIYFVEKAEACKKGDAGDLSWKEESEIEVIK